MADIQFEWDRTKEKSNKRKHGVSFEEARTVFFDEFAVRFFDVDHSGEEDRFIMLGLSFQLRVVLVCHCYRENETKIRIISARKANAKEEAAYWRRR